MTNKIGRVYSTVQLSNSVQLTENLIQEFDEELSINELGELLLLNKIYRKR